MARRLLDAFGPEVCTWSFSAPMPAMIARATTRWSRSPGGWASDAWRQAMCTRMRNAEPSCRMRLWRCATTPRSMPQSPCVEAITAIVMSTPQAMARRFSDLPEPVSETLLLAERLTFDLDMDLGYRYPEPRIRAPSGAWPNCAASAWRVASVHAPPAPRRTRAWKRSCA